MSADNWTICPRCEQNQKDDVKRRKQKVKDSFGVVPLEEYQRLIREAKDPVVIEDTFREDYELGIYNGKFYVSYKGYCTVCGWRHTFRHTETLFDE